MFRTWSKALIGFHIPKSAGNQCVGLAEFSPRSSVLDGIALEDSPPVPLSWTSSTTTKVPPRARFAPATGGGKDLNQRPFGGSVWESKEQRIY
jgi:hypothetical protein